MVRIVAPTLPRRLYRYRKLYSSNTSVSSKEFQEREIKAIRENYLWCSLFDNLNDPMEGIFGLTPTAARASDGAHIPGDVQNLMRKMGVCCFSDTYENDLMWAHYAGEYRGICVQYSTNDLCNGLPGVNAVRMQYDIQIPILRAAEAADRQESAIKALSTKKSDWHYEREWRFIANPGMVDVPGTLQINGKNPVKGIFFGSRTEFNVIDAFKEALIGVRDDTIKFYRPVLRNRSYRYEWEQLK